jgi:hypothetical protein
MNKEFGQELVLKHSGSWSDQALDLLERFLKKTRVEFTMDEFRAYATDVGLSEPHHFNAWGALFAHAARLNLIRFTGNVWESSRPESHKRLIRGWVKA